MKSNARFEATFVPNEVRPDQTFFETMKWMRNSLPSWTWAHLNTWPSRRQCRLLPENQGELLKQPWVLTQLCICLSCFAYFLFCLLKLMAREKVYWKLVKSNPCSVSEYVLVMGSDHCSLLEKLRSCVTEEMWWCHRPFLANGCTAFIWKLCCHWLKGLWFQS